MPLIALDHYQVRDAKHRSRSPFKFKKLWAVSAPAVEMYSDKHGDLSVAFEEDGSITLTHWSARYNRTPDAENVFPTRLTIRQ